MSEARLASGLRVAALLRLLSQQAVAAYVLHRGDDTAGAILIRANHLDGRSTLLVRERDWDSGALSWVERPAAPDADVDAAIAAEIRRDRDLWVIEIEGPPARFAFAL